MNGNQTEARLIAALDGEDLQAQLDTIRLLTDDPPLPITDSVIESLCRCLSARDGTIARRAADALVALAPRDRRTTEGLRRRLSSPDRRASWGAAYALARIGLDDEESAVIDRLVKALSDKDSDVRWAAVDLLTDLARSRPDAVRVRLFKHARKGDPLGFRMVLYCVRNLKTEGPDVTALVRRASHSDDAPVRLAALAILARIASPNAAGAEIALTLLEGDADPGVRRAAAAALGHLALPSSRALAALKKAASSRADPSLSRSARSALARIERR